MNPKSSILSFILISAVFWLACEDSTICKGPEDCSEGYFCDSEGYCTQLTAFVRCGEDRCFAPQICVDGLRCEDVDRGGGTGGVDAPLAGSESLGGVESSDRGIVEAGEVVSDLSLPLDMEPMIDMRLVVDMNQAVDMAPDPLMRDQGGQTCQTACDCPNGLSCSGGECTAEGDPVYCCGGSFCPPGEACQTSSGARDICLDRLCSTACDCNPGLSCIGGTCVLDSEPVFCCDRGSCPSGSSCEDQRGVRGMCPSDPCTSACDCTPGQRCVEGLCLLQGDPVFCCDQGICPAGEACQDSNGSLALCQGEVSCTSACDCMTGMACTLGVCALGSSPIFCCDEGFCPVGERCEPLGGGRLSLCE